MCAILEKVCVFIEGVDTYIGCIKMYIHTYIQCYNGKLIHTYIHTFIQGDEGITGLYNQFDSTAVVISEAAVVFETIGFGTYFKLLPYIHPAAVHTYILFFGAPIFYLRNHFSGRENKVTALLCVGL